MYVLFAVNTQLSTVGFDSRISHYSQHVSTRPLRPVIWLCVLMMQYLQNECWKILANCDTRVHIFSDLLCCCLVSILLEAGPCVRFDWDCAVYWHHNWVDCSLCRVRTKQFEWFPWTKIFMWTAFIVKYDCTVYFLLQTHTYTHAHTLTSCGWVLFE